MPYFVDASGQRFVLYGHRSCNYRSKTQVHNFGRACRCMKADPYGGGGLVQHHMDIGEPHICDVCGRTFTQ
jgi:hypothetical protein